MQVPLQSLKPGLQFALHVPPVQVALPFDGVLQAAVQPPQWLGSDEVSMHWPLQHVEPAGQLFTQTLCVVSQLWQGRQLSRQALVVVSHVWHWLQVLTHWPVVGLQLWHDPQVTGVQVVPSALQVWHGPQPPPHCPVVGSQE
jgi:hypothetical protein